MSDSFLDRVQSGKLRNKVKRNNDELVDEGLICPYCTAQLEDEEDFRSHVTNQHSDVGLNEDALKRLCDFKRGIIDSVDI